MGDHGVNRLGEGRAEDKEAVKSRPERHEDAAALRAEREHLLQLKSELAAIKAEIKFQRLLRAFKAYNPNQPRVPAGNPDGGQWTAQRDVGPSAQLAGLIRICVVGVRSLSTDQWGNKSFAVTYDCAGGRSFTVRGTGNSFPGIVLDPFQ